MPLHILEQITLGAVQGIAEWLPVSSEGMILLVKTAIFKSEASFSSMISEALFLHIGSALAAIIYFRKDLARLCRSLRKTSEHHTADQPLIRFLVISTILSGLIGISLLNLVSSILAKNSAPTQLILLFIGACLLATGTLQLINKKTGHRTAKDLTLKDSIILGITQAFAALPGLSRSGLTVAALLLNKFDAPNSIRISFLMSIPIILGGNIAMNIAGNTFEPERLIGLAVSFLFSMLTIHVLLKAAQKINFGVFVILMGLLIIVSAMIPVF